MKIKQFNEKYTIRWERNYDTEKPEMKFWKGISKDKSREILSAFLNAD
ncbi:MAG: hypothetical protein PUA69_08975 [Erysipelotrichaceae bacterium]|jgi:hypothetical protein|nr:hypothetical protein [Erysipelotrichaceae bacterium]